MNINPHQPSSTLINPHQPSSTLINLINLINPSKNFIYLKKTILLLFLPCVRTRNKNYLDVCTC